MTYEEDGIGLVVENTKRKPVKLYWTEKIRDILNSPILIAETKLKLIEAYCDLEEQDFNKKMDEKYENN